jgi:hypothetical protein
MHGRIVELTTTNHDLLNEDIVLGNWEMIVPIWNRGRVLRAGDMLSVLRVHHAIKGENHMPTSSFTSALPAGRRLKLGRLPLQHGSVSR